MEIRQSAQFIAGKIGGTTRRRLAAILVMTGVGASALGGLAPQGEAATTESAVGTVADITWGTSSDDVDATVSAMAAAGIRWVRANVSWSGGEPVTKGALNQGYLQQIDYAVTKAKAAGMEVLMPIADGVPYWASADPAKYTDGSGQHWNKYWRPTNPSDYADFVTATVNRYKALGVRTYEVWNEPNHTPFWPSGPNAGEFKALLAAAYPAIKAVDPGATVLMGGLSKNDYDYLEQLYAAGARPYFDAVAVHPYTGTADPTWCWTQAGTTKLAKDAFCAIEEVRKTMVANGDSAKSIWLTEFGWSTHTGSYGVSEATQADFLTKALNKIQSSYPYVAASFWYNFRNNFWQNNLEGDYEANLGLLRVDFSPKPSYDAMRTWTGAATTTTTTVAPPTTTTSIAPADTVAPVLSNVAAKRVTKNAATITWATNEASSSVVEFGTTSLTSTRTGANGVSAHSVNLTGLAPRTTYIYRVKSEDAAGNMATSAVYSFTTARK
jgi:polysaccharide biosynthesis protein PslG